MSGDRGLLATLGVRTRQVADLDEGALYIPEAKLLLLDIELSHERVSCALDRVLPMLWEDA